MTVAPTHEGPAHKQLRLWPGVVAVVALWLARFGLKAVIPGFAGFELGMMWGFGGVCAVLAWWVFLAGRPWSERLGVPIVMAAALAGTWQVKHESMGPLWLLGYAVPFLCLAWSWARPPAVASRWDRGAR